MPKKNIFYVISYFLLIVFFFLGTLFYRQSFLAVLLLLECLLPALSIGITYFVSRKISFHLVVKHSEITVGNPINVIFSLDNPTIFPLLNCEVSFKYGNLFYQNNDLNHSICLSAQPKKTTTYTLPFATKYSGMFSLQIQSIQITDFLHMKSFSIPYHKNIDIPIIPEEKEINIIKLPQSNEAAEDGDFLKKYGVVSTEFGGVREYIPGDRLQNVHWKMSAKADDLLVREPQPVAERFMTIVPELEKNHLEETIKTFFSFAYTLVREHELFHVALFSYSDKTFSYHLVSNEDQLREVLFQLYYENVYSGSALAKEYYTSQNETAEFLSIYNNDIIYYYGKEALQ